MSAVIREMESLAYRQFVLAGYCGNSEGLDEALADWAEAYGAQTLKDHAALLRAIKSGRLEVLQEP